MEESQQRHMHPLRFCLVIARKRKGWYRRSCFAKILAIDVAQSIS